MKRRYFAVICILALSIMACAPETKVYKVEYKGNNPEGAFRAAIGNNTIFTNSNIVEVQVQKNPNYFCYSVNREVLCKVKVNVKVNENAAGNYREVTQKLKESMLSSGKNLSVLPERFAYFIYDEKVEEEVLFVNNLQNKSTYALSIPVSGKGADEAEAQKNALKKIDGMLGILTDKK